jgi:hypothetical protein
VSSVNGARVKNLQWQILPTKDIACSKTALAASPAVAAAPDGTAEAPAPARKVELQLTVTLASGLGPRVKLQQATKLSMQLSQLTGVVVLEDAARRLRDGDISAGNTPSDSDQDLTWCAVFPGGLANAAAPSLEQKP